MTALTIEECMGGRVGAMEKWCHLLSRIVAGMNKEVTLSEEYGGMRTREMGCLVVLNMGWGPRRFEGTSEIQHGDWGQDVGFRGCIVWVALHYRR